MFLVLSRAKSRELLRPRHDAVFYIVALSLLVLDVVESTRSLPAAGLGANMGVLSAALAITRLSTHLAEYT